MKRIYLIVLLATVFISSCSVVPDIKNIKPTARFSSLHTSSTNVLEISFDASESYDEDGKIISYSWDFGDTNKAIGSTVIHKFTKAGRYLVRLSVKDDKNETNSITKTIVINDFVKNIKPVAIFSLSDTKAEIGTKINFDASESKDKDGRITSYYWDFGDGETSTGISTSHIYKKSSSYEISLRVVDNKGESSAISKTIVVTALDIYQPPVSVLWQWQLDEDSDKRINTSYTVDVYDLDLFDVEPSLIKELHAKDIKVICYFSAGSYEKWRADAGEFPKDVLGRSLENWAAEKWLDIRSVKVRSIMSKRLDLAKQKGCDGVEPDNMDGFEDDDKKKDKTGFDLSPKDQIDYNKFIAKAAHLRGLAVGLKNDLQQIEQLVENFDFAINEQCFEYNECGLLSIFIEKGKPVLNAEYKKKYIRNISARHELCRDSKNLKFSTLILPEDLNDKYRYDCLGSEEKIY